MSEHSNVAPMPKVSHHAPLSRKTSLQDAFDHPQFLARIKQATPKHLSADRMLAVFVQSIQKTPKLREVDVMSLLGAFLSVASVGLEPNTALQHAHLIPFEKNRWNPQTKKRELERVDVQVIFGYQGLLELAYRSGLLKSVHADVVWGGDEFDFWYGSGGSLRHKPVGGPRAEGEMPKSAYMYAAMKHEGEAFEVMPMSDIIAVRNATQAFQSAVRAKEAAAEKGWKLPASFTEAPWIKHFVPMARKTVFRHGSKWLPKSIEMAAAVALDELQDRRSAKFSDVIEGSADVLNGGLEAIEDDSYQGNAAGTDFTGYSQQDDRAQPVQRNAPAPQATKAAATPVRPAFQHYLVDAEGEVVDDVITDPGIYVERLTGLFDANDNKAMVIENNLEAIEAVMAAQPGEGDLLETLRDRAAPPVPVDDGPTAAIVMKANGRGADLGDWIKRAKNVIGTLDADQLAAWVANNEPVYGPFPASKRLEVGKALSERSTALGVSPPKAQPSTDLLGQQPVGKTAAQWVEEQVMELDLADTSAAVVAHAERIQQQMTELKDHHTGLWRTVNDAFTARMTDLKRSESLNKPA